MKIFLSLCMLVFCVFSSDALAEQAAPIQVPTGNIDTRPLKKNFGFGISLGAPTGLTMKYHFTPSSALQMGIGGAGHGFLSLHADYVLSLAKLVEAQNVGMLYGYAGGGLGVGFFGNSGLLGFRYSTIDNVYVDVHATFGLAWNFAKLPLDLFVEVAPGLLVVPGIGFGWHGTIGGRFYL